MSTHKYISCDNDGCTSRIDIQPMMIGGAIAVSEWTKLTEGLSVHDFCCTECLKSFLHLRDLVINGKRGCEVCGEEAVWDCQHSTGRSTLRCDLHSNDFQITENKRKL